MSKTFYLYPYYKDFKDNDFTLLEMSKKSTYCNNICISNINKNLESQSYLKNKFINDDILKIDSNKVINKYKIDDTIK